MRYVVTVDLYYKPNFDLQSRDTLELALTDAAWARDVYQPDEQFAGYSHNVFITEYDDSAETSRVLRRWRWTSKNTKGHGYWQIEVENI